MVASSTPGEISRVVPVRTSRLLLRSTSRILANDDTPISCPHGTGFSILQRRFRKRSPPSFLDADVRAYPKWIHEFLLALRNLPLLEELVVMDMLTYSIEVPNTPDIPDIPLPSLKCLKFSADDSRAATATTRHLQLPSSVRLQIYLRFLDNISEHALDGLESLGMYLDRRGPLQSLYLFGDGIRDQDLTGELSASGFGVSLVAWRDPQDVHFMRPNIHDANVILSFSFKPTISFHIPVDEVNSTLYNFISTAPFSHVRSPYCFRPTWLRAQHL